MRPGHRDTMWSVEVPSPGFPSVPFLIPCDCFPFTLQFRRCAAAKAQAAQSGSFVTPFMHAGSIPLMASRLIETSGACLKRWCQYRAILSAFGTVSSTSSLQSLSTSDFDSSSDNSFVSTSSAPYGISAGSGWISFICIFEIVCSVSSFRCRMMYCVCPSSV